MVIAIILFGIFLPSCISLIFSAIQKSKIKVSKTMSDKNFAVFLPKTVAIIGAMGSLTSLAVIIPFTFFSDEQPHFIFYVVFGLLNWLGTYLIVKTFTFKVIVNGEKITVCSAFRRPYSFTFDKIISAVRQVKRNQTKSERIVIKTANNKRLIVESSEVSYKRFKEKIQLQVKREYLVGFNSVK